MRNGRQTRRKWIISGKRRPAKDSSLTVFTEMTPDACFRLINNSCPLEARAYSSCADTSWFPSDGLVPCWPIRNSSLLWAFPPCTVLGVFHPVHSPQPQWGHLNVIHFFRNTLQNEPGFRGRAEGVVFDLLLRGPFGPFTRFWVIYMRPALTKLSFTVPMICTLLSQNDCIWNLICLLYGW